MNKNVFQYHNGIENVFADPLRAWGIILIKLEGKVAEICTRARNKDETVPVAEQQLAAMRLDDAVCVAFEMPPFDPKTGQGSTLLDRLRVWGEFSAYMDEKKKQPDSSVTFSAPTPSEALYSDWRGHPTEMQSTAAQSSDSC